jgi:hypothetical protein
LVVAETSGTAATVAKTPTALGWTKAAIMRILTQLKDFLTAIVGKVRSAFTGALKAVKEIPANAAQSTRFASIARANEAGAKIKGVNAVGKMAANGKSASDVAGAAGRIIGGKGSWRSKYEVARIYLKSTRYLAQYYLGVPLKFVKNTISKLFSFFMSPKGVVASTALTMAAPSGASK